jgi:hypothetical protein
MQLTNIFLATLRIDVNTVQQVSDEDCRLIIKRRCRVSTCHIQSVCLWPSESESCNKETLSAFRPTDHCMECRQVNSKHFRWVQLIYVVIYTFFKITLMMEAASTYETSANFYQTTRRNNPEDSHLHVLLYCWQSHILSELGTTTTDGGATYQQTLCITIITCRVIMFVL